MCTDLSGFVAFDEVGGAKAVRAGRLHHLQGLPLSKTGWVRLRLRAEGRQTLRAPPAGRHQKQVRQD
jgi:hypothetical protein